MRAFLVFILQWRNVELNWCERDRLTDRNTTNRSCTAPNQLDCHAFEWQIGHWLFVAIYKHLTVSTMNSLDFDLVLTWSYTVSPCENQPSKSNSYFSSLCKYLFSCGWMRSPARRKCQFRMQIGYGVSPRPLGFGTTWYSPDRYIRPDRNGIDIRCQIGLEEFRPLYRTHPMGQTTGQSKIFAPPMSLEYFISWASKDFLHNSIPPLCLFT